MACRKTIETFPVIARESLGVTENNSHFLTRLQREHAHLECAAVNPLQQCRVTTSMSDLFEHISTVIPFDHPPFHQRPVHIHRQARKRRIRGKRKAKCSLQLLPCVIEVRLVNRRPGKPVFDVNINMKLPQRKFHFLALRIHDGDRTARMFARRNDHGIRSHQVLDPFHDVRGTLRRTQFCQMRFGLVRNQLLASRDDLIESTDSDFPLRDNHIRGLTLSFHDKLRTECRHFTASRFHDEPFG